MQKEFYYCCSSQLGVGSIILPGNWGRMISQYTQNKVNATSGWLAAREYLFETCRLEINSSLPSRLKSNFMCTSIEDLNVFIRTYNRIFDLKYKVELLDNTLPNYMGNWDLCNFNPDDSLENLKVKAKKYWSFCDPLNKEFLTYSPVKIIEIIDDKIIDKDKIINS